MQIWNWNFTLENNTSTLTMKRARCWLFNCLVESRNTSHCIGNFASSVTRFCSVSFSTTIRANSRYTAMFKNIAKYRENGLNPLNTVGHHTRDWAGRIEAFYFNIREHSVDVANAILGETFLVRINTKTQ